MLKNFRNATLALGIAVYLMCLWTAPAAASLMGSSPSNGSPSDSVRMIEVEKIQKALEQRIVTDKLVACGMNPAEVKSKLSQMSDDQIHMLAQASDNVLAGGDGIGVVIGVLVIILLVIVIMKLLDKEIIIR
ncbi:MAG TPA: hypothetical protein ENF48_03235 [Desulfobacteraceae bacterium]|nr:PA2779 family protein [Deltaproteobacteria bacterium]MBW2356151.1 PA2779 family protein [Deltaproteobacteria bacterium]RLB95876.1 MAG: hypothetical protein DRH76_07510 [Deltaproteobacteria bacterium]HDI59363.1 hypothetical protein [Desulfobacteraceae bacterium]